MKKYTIIIIALILIITGAAWFGITHLFTSQKIISGYVVKNDKVYYDTVMQISRTSTQQKISELEVVGADAKTFIILADGWGKDINNVYYVGFTVKPESSSIPPINLPTFTATRSLYGPIGKDKNGVYTIAFVYSIDGSGNADWEYQLLEGADSSTFLVMDELPYAKDKTNVYYLARAYGVRKIAGADGTTFKILGVCASAGSESSYYATDAHSVIAYDHILLGSNLSTFKIVGTYGNVINLNSYSGTTTTYYAVDKNHVYKNCGEIVPNVSPEQCNTDNQIGRAHV